MSWATPVKCERIPLSFSEELLWRTEREAATAAPFFDCALTLVIGWRLSNVPDVKRLTQSVSAVLERQQLLQSRIEQIEDGVYRTNGPATGNECRLLDWRDA